MFCEYKTSLSSTELSGYNEQTIARIQDLSFLVGLLGLALKRNTSIILENIMNK